MGVRRARGVERARGDGRAGLAREARGGAERRGHPRWSARGAEKKRPRCGARMRAKMWRMPRRRRAAASRSTSQCGMRTHLVKVRLELQVLQALLNEGDEGAGGKLRALRDGRLRDEGFVAEGVRGVRKSAFLQVSVDEVVDLVGGDGHRCRGPDGADVPCRREVGAIPGRPRGVGMRLGFVCRGIYVGSALRFDRAERATR